MSSQMLTPALNSAEAASFDPGFDVISYPLGIETRGIIVDTGYEADLGLETHILPGEPAVLYASAQAITETEPEVAARYRALAGDLSQAPEHVTVISDRPENTDAAMGLGMGAVHVTAEEGLQASLDLLLDPAGQTDERFYERPAYSELSYPEVISALCPRGEINVVGFVGRTGVGKSTTLGRLVDTVDQKGGRASIFELDGFFKKSRSERKRWLTEPCISDDERAERENVTNWWDFEAAIEALDRIRNGEHVRMEGMYEMDKGGEKTGTLDIDPGTGGYSVFVEGTALLLPIMCEAIDSFVYLNAHDRVRTQSLLERNRRDGYTPEESAERKRLTDAAELQNHLSFPLRSRRYAKRRLGVLDNSARSDHLTLLPPYISRR